MPITQAMTSLPKCAHCKDLSYTEDSVQSLFGYALCPPCFNDLPLMIETAILEVGRFYLPVDYHVPRCAYKDSRQRDFQLSLSAIYNWYFLSWWSLGYNPGANIRLYQKMVPIDTRLDKAVGEFERELLAGRKQA